MNQLRGQYQSLSADHEDIAQEVAIKLMGGLSQFAGSTRYELEAYLGTIIRNTAETHRCRPSRQSVADELTQKERRRLQGTEGSPTSDEQVACSDSAPLPLEQQQDCRLSPERIAQINPKNAEALYNYAWNLESRQNYEEAITYYEAALAQEPKDIETLYQLGLSCLALAQRDKALTMYERLKPEERDERSCCGG